MAVLEDDNALERNAKLVTLTFIILLTFVAYALKLFSLQALEGRTYRRQSQRISSQIRQIPAQRGEIFDRNATLPMVINTDSFAVDITPAEIPEGYYDTVATRLATYLGISKADIDIVYFSSLAYSFFSSSLIKL